MRKYLRWNWDGQCTGERGLIGEGEKGGGLRVDVVDADEIVFDEDLAFSGLRDW